MADREAGGTRGPVTRREVLPNGVRLLVREMRAAPAVALNLWVGSGSADDPEGLGGLSHFVEHLLFRSRDGRADLAREVQEAGGHLNARTGCDHTMYHEVVPPDGWEGVLSAQAAALGAPGFDPEAVTSERAVIIEEAKGGEEIPESFVWRRLMETVFLRHPCRRPVVGTEEGLAGVRATDLRRHFDRHYVGSNVVQVVVGDIDADRAVEFARGALSPLPAGPLPDRPAVREPRQDRPRARCFAGEVAQSYLAVGFRIPHVLHEDLPALDMACGLLGVGRSSRLRKLLQVGGGLVSDVGAGIVGLRDAGVLLVRAVAAESGPVPVIAGIFRGIAELGAVAPDAAEMRRAVRRLEAAYVLEHEVPDAVAHTMGFFEMLGDYRRGDDYLDRLAAVSPSDVRRVVGTYLDAAVSTIVAYVPPGLELSDEELRESAESGAEIARRRHRGAARERPGPYTTETFRRPLLVAERSAEDVVVEEMQSGGRLLVSHSAALPLVSIALGFRGGFVEEPEGREGITYLAENLTTRGAGGRTAARLADEMESYGSAVATVVDRDGFGQGAAALSRHFRDITALLAETVLSPTFAPAQVEALRAEVVAEIGEIMDHPLRRATARLLPLIFPGHPYGRQLRGTPESLASLGRDDVEQWHRSIVGSDRLVVAVVGDVRPAEAREVIADVLSGLGRSAVPERANAVGTPDGGRIEFAGAARGRSTVAIGYPGTAARDPDSLVARLISRSISTIGGRLWTALRERGPHAYFAGSSYVSLRESGALLVHVMVPAGREDDAVEAASAVLCEVASGGFSEEELDRAKRHFSGTYRLSMQRGSTRAATHVMAELLDVGYERVARTPELVSALTNEDVKRVARRWMDGPGRAVAVVERGR